MSSATFVQSAPTTPDTAASSTSASAAPKGTSFRRRLTAASFAGAGVLTLASLSVDSFSADSSNRAYLESYAAAPDKVMLSATLLHFGYLFIVPAVFAMAFLTRRAAPRLSNATIVFGILAAGLNGLVSVDMYDVALATTLPMEQALETYAAAGSYWPGIVIALPSLLGHVVATVLAVAAAGRVRMVSRWLWIPTLASFVAFAVGAKGAIAVAALGGLAGLAVILILTGLAVLRLDDATFERGA